METTELVTWLNTVDQSYREEFRELFDTNFDRFGARVGQQLAEVRSEMARLETRLVRWMFAFWVTTWLAAAGTMFALQRLH